MDYEKEYKKKLEDAKYWHDCSEGDIPAILEEIFSELREESEDEKIRKALIDYFDDANKADENPLELYGIHTDKVLAWLEKQGKQEEPQVYETEDGEVITYSETDGYKVVEPKFKVGDFVVDNCGYTWKIEGILNQFYILECVEGGESRPTIEWVDKTYHLWTIQDAKDGDVLATWAGAFIYNGNNGGGSCPGSYCGIDTLGGFKTGVEHHWTGKSVFPSTKEQRGLLFQKMKEEGYEWDAEKKELRKIEPKPAWSEEDEKIFRALSNALARISSNTRTDSTSINYSFFTEIDWLKSLKERVKSQWKPSEEHIRYLQAVVNDVNNIGSESCCIALKELLEQLKKL